MQFPRFKVLLQWSLMKFSKRTKPSRSCKVN